MNDKKNNNNGKSLIENKINNLPEMNLTARLVVGECEIEISEILKLGQGSIIELNTLSEDPFELWINDKKIATARPVLIKNKIGAEITKISTEANKIKKIALKSL